MKITQKLVAEVKRMNKKYHHDQAWHDFIGSKEVQSINYSLCTLIGASNREIVEDAKKYMADVEWVL